MARGSAGPAPSLTRWTKAISEHSRSSRWREALLLWCQDLGDLGVEANTFAFNAAMAACRQGGLWDGALGLFVEARVIGVEMDTVSLNTCLSARRGVSWKSALGFLRTSKRAALQLDAFTCTAFFGISKGKWWLAQTFLEAQRQQALPIAGNLQLRNSYLSAALKDNWALALLLLKETNTPQDAVTFKAISGPFSRSIAWEACIVLVEDSQLQRLLGNGMGSTPLLSSLAQGQLWQMAACILGSQASIASTTAAASACERVNNWELALALPIASLNQGPVDVRRVHG
eukprot:Skav204720  [mRNA]  locus=scaffold1549:150512:151372:+ [translate_table: standard]